MPYDDSQESTSSWNLLAKILAVILAILLLGFIGETYYLYRILNDHPPRIPLPKVTVPLPKSPSLFLSNRPS
jgi:hypothetical protein